MKKLVFIALALVVVLWMGSPAMADFIDLPVKWAQLPDFGGIDYLSDHTVPGLNVMADDFICYEPLPIVAVRWWGSQLGGSLQPDGHGVGPFDISFHLSLPGAPTPHPFSIPDGAPVYLQSVFAQREYTGVTDGLGDYVYMYNAFLPVPFDQWIYAEQSPVLGELWIDICKPTGEMWGWHEAATQQLDYAAQGFTHNGPWGTHPALTDMAFELMTVPVPGTLLLLGSGLVGLVGLGRRRFIKR